MARASTIIPSDGGGPGVLVPHEADAVDDRWMADEVDAALFCLELEKRLRPTWRPRSR